MSEIKFKLVFQHPTSKEIIISSPILLDDLINKYSDIYELVEKFCTCNCQPIGETNVVECNCCDYFDEFECIDKLQYTGLKDCKGVEIYEGDILKVWIEGHLQTSRYHVENMCDFYLQTERDDSYLRFQEYEVIGNIHETPELLEAAK